MSKSLGNFFTVRDLLDQGWPGEVIRFVMLSTHYRSPMDWTEEKAREAESTLRKWYAMTENVGFAIAPDEAIDALLDDLNTPLFLSILHKLAKERMWSELNAALALIGLERRNLLLDLKSIDIKDAIEELFERRLEARAMGNWRLSDILRGFLYISGVSVKDGDNPEWSLSNDLEAMGWKTLAKDIATENSIIRLHDFEEIAEARGLVLNSDFTIRNPVSGRLSTEAQLRHLHLGLKVVRDA